VKALFLFPVVYSPQACDTQVPPLHIPVQQSVLTLHVGTLGLQHAPSLLQPDMPIEHCVHIPDELQHPHLPLMQVWPFGHAPQFATDEQALSVLGHTHVPSKQFGVATVHAPQPATDEQALSVLGHEHTSLMHLGVLPPHAVHPPVRPPLAHMRSLLGHTQVPPMHSGVLSPHSHAASISSIVIILLACLW
jgi:hypothetical protein